jgi:glycosyltransferase involved in cell wall biosynthesis
VSTNIHNPKIAVAIFTKNEEANIRDCILSLDSMENIYVIDSNSTDNTRLFASELGAEILNFDWNGSYPRKKQWTLDQLSDFDKVILFDADLRATPKWLQELKEICQQDFAGALCPIEYHFMGKKIRYGIKVYYFAILNPRKARFPNVEIPGQGYGDIEFHYQPVISGTIKKMLNPVLHDDNDPLTDWITRHEKYAMYQAMLNTSKLHSKEINLHKTIQGRLFSKVPFKATLRFMYSYLLRLGFLDGLAGFRYQWWLSQHYYLTKLYEEDLKRVH